MAAEKGNKEAIEFLNSEGIPLTEPTPSPSAPAPTPAPPPTSPAEECNKRANQYHKNRQFDLAIKEYGEAIRLNPNEGVYYGNRAGSYHAKGDNAQAIKDLEKAISLDPSDQWAKDLLNEIRNSGNKIDLVAMSKKK